jgi:DNA end-binding protein Ku
VALCPEARQDDILLNDNFHTDADAAGTNEFQERAYVILPDKGRDTSIATSTHAVDIFAFVDAREIPFRCFQTPYFLAPAPGGERVYALLRETLRRSRKIGIAWVVIQMRRQLAVLVPHGQSLILNTLRCENEADMPRPLPAWFDDADDAGLSESELAFARQLVDSMTEQWDVLLQVDRLRHGVDGLELQDGTQPAPFETPDVINLDDVLEWAEEQDAGYDEEMLDAFSPRPHRRSDAPASRRSGTARAAAGRHVFRPKQRRMN